MKELLLKALRSPRGSKAQEDAVDELVKLFEEKERDSDA